MTPRVIKLGGILALLSLPLALAYVALLALEANGAVQTAVLAVSSALTAFVLWTTKGLFNRLNFRSANVPIFGIIAVSVVSLILNVVVGDGLEKALSAEDPQLTATQIALGIAILVMSLALCALWFWFAIATIRYGNVARSGTWKAVGILYVTAGATIFAAIVIGAVGFATSSFTNALLYVAGGGLMIAGAALIASWICQAIGLLVGASRLTSNGAAKA